MKARYQYRIYPSDQQRKDLARLFGCVRVVWNDALALCKKSEKLPSNGDLQKICITQAKKTKEREWLSDVSNIPLQQSIADLGVAWNNFFASRKGRRKGQKMNQPRFKKRTNQQSARFRKGGFSIKDFGVRFDRLTDRAVPELAEGQSNAVKVFLAKIGYIKTKWSRPLPSEPSSVAVIKDTAGRYFLSFVVEVQPEIKPASNPAIGIDLGLKTFAACSDGNKFSSPDYKKLDRRTRIAQRQLSRRSSGSKRRERMRLRVAKLKAKLRDTRKDFLHKLSTKVVNENQVIALEDLNVSGMLKNRKLSRAISQAGWREFRTMCEAKSDKHGREFVVISRWAPTSQICSDCGYRWGKLDLKVREIVCFNCGAFHDRDDNASRNIENVGVGHTHDPKWTGRECKTSVEAVPVELSTHLKYEQLRLFDW